MAVTATPIGDSGCAVTPSTLPTPSQPAACEGVSTHTPRPEREPVTGVSLPQRPQTFSIETATDGRLRMVFKTPDGTPIDLTGCLCTEETETDDPDCPCPLVLRFRTREHADPGVIEKGYEVEVVDAAAGEVDIILTPENTAVPGVFRGELSLAQCAADQDDETSLFTMPVFLVVAASLWSAHAFNGPPSMMEIRLFLRDTSPAESRLLSAVKFSDAEVAIAISHPVQYWNEIPPPITTYTTANFPFRHHWLLGICGYLFRIAAEQQRANYLQYSAGGVTVADQAKEASYDRAADQRLAEYKDFVYRKKVAMNMEEGFSYVPSIYARRYVY